MTVPFKEERMKRLALALCGLMLIVGATADAEIPYVVGDPIADFTLNDAYGTPVSLYDFENTVILLNFWTDT
jgi:cytochrome oxidase Cu insertion factor (SCO1/SenC/PrrC family)